VRLRKKVAEVHAVSHTEPTSITELFVSTHLSANFSIALL
jgi:hypothetical protein